MAQIPYADTQSSLSVEVQLTHAADVFLVDSSNFHKYKSGQSFKYFGGHYTKTPVHISVDGAGRWYLIVRGGGQYQYRFY
ncbi:hypothetical protein SR42_14905 [Clostridium botulinum]|uniref:DUF1883 domain-containing protein n=1 Tax=Clostridium botulinum TaxID=1491 RepID=UPI0005976D24|nr:DUF1883 domain-containing protein [Clostridium botulinum]KIL07459.1 hypothetical protein SR42_14905 [Clostridium botulinum]MBY6934514.1 DUF1883 domain-containing protein [Clostridium botulinum]NFL83308.1 DUF1883 domain-containing protein [Clostridium botulinum]NFN13089.1 DUF1883 domain-containing protein [Clostridium botulinum]NFO38316.1 DUF1883 domain-containing protein [Clostridium botulinum]